MSLPTATTTGITTAEVAIATNKSTATTVLLNENQNCDDEDLDEANSKPHLSSPLLLHTRFLATNQCK